MGKIWDGKNIFPFNSDLLFILIYGDYVFEGVIKFIMRIEHI
jgi:hypothetical protein